MDDEVQGHNRRTYDDLIPVVMLQVEERLRETRHSLRQEMAVLAANVATGQVQASREHEAVRADIADLKRCVTELTPLSRTVKQLHEQALSDKAHDQAIRELKRVVRWGFTTLLAVIVAAAAVLGVILS